MRTNVNRLLIAMALLGGINRAGAQGARFFRISGPAATTIIAFRPDGSMVWGNAQPGATYTVQTAGVLSGGSNWTGYVRIAVTNNVSTNQIVAFNPPAGMALIPAGVFTMGDTLDGETDAASTNLTVSAFFMDVNLVSYSQWQLVYTVAVSAGYDFIHAGSGKAATHPVQSVDWFDAVKWCNARSQQAGLTPVYYTDAGLTQVYTNGEVTPYVNGTASGYRLPTEAEWEKAARGGLSGQRFPWGNVISESLANYQGNTAITYDLGPGGYNAAFATGSFPYTSPVGTFAPNGYGLYDMGGNVSAWCWNWFGTPYAGGSDPSGPASGTFRVLRGGGWGVFAYSERCAYRNEDFPMAAHNDYGIRCVRGL